MKKYKEMLATAWSGGSKKKIILSLSVIGIVAAMAVGVTVSYFRDTETSTGNQFVAGKFNLLVGSQCSYNGETQLPCNWLKKDLANELFFNFDDIKPGDSGENTITLRADNNDAWICAQFANLVSDDNGCDSPENKVDDPINSCGDPGAGQGELQNHLFFTIWRDNGAGANACNNILDAGETTIVDNQPANSNFWPIADSEHGPAISGDTDYCVGIAWNVPIETNNIIQTDSLVGNVVFNAVQARNLDTFKCADLTPTACVPTNGSVETCGNGIDEDCNGSDLQCEPACVPATEVCNGLDDNCDQVIDEGNPGGGGACTTGLQGICSAGLLSCQNGAISCVQGLISTTEACGDQLDNDCDGSVDENCVIDVDGDGYALGADCNDADSNIHPGALEICNNSDDDCNGATDEGLATPSNCGVGACYRTGSNACTNGQYLDMCIPGIPTTETCGNLIDEDCSGSDLACPLDLCAGVNCDDSNMCTNDSCFMGNCTHTNANGGGCLNFGCVTAAGTCQSGSCVCTTSPTCTDSASCTDNDPCTDDTCFLGLQCQHSVKTCDDGNAGTHDACNPNNGACTNFPYPTFDYTFCLDLPWGGQWCNHP